MPPASSGAISPLIFITATFPKRVSFDARIMTTGSTRNRKIANAATIRTIFFPYLLSASFAGIMKPIQLRF